MTRLLTIDEVSEQKVTLYFAVGYPMEFAELVGNFDDPDAMSFEGYMSRFSKLYLETDRRQSMPAHIEFRTHRDHTMVLDDLDGLSGSPVSTSMRWCETFASISTHLCGIGRPGQATTFLKRRTWLSQNGSTRS
jgi:hypothetical protein